MLARDKNIFDRGRYFFTATYISIDFEKEKEKK